LTVVCPNGVPAGGATAAPQVCTKGVDDGEGDDVGWELVRAGEAEAGRRAAVDHEAGKAG
jgi:hypothetical protein